MPRAIPPPPLDRHRAPLPLIIASLYSLCPVSLYELLKKKIPPRVGLETQCAISLIIPPRFFLPQASGPKFDAGCAPLARTPVRLYLDNEDPLSPFSSRRGLASPLSLLVKASPLSHLVFHLSHSDLPSVLTSVTLCLASSWGY